MAQRFDPPAWMLPFGAMLRRCLIVVVPAFLAFVLNTAEALAQEGAKVKILHADSWEFDDAFAPGAQRLKGDARFSHENAVMQCDSAWIHADRTVEAYGHVHIRQGDSLEVFSDRLHYDPSTRLATLTGNVRLLDAEMELTTQHLVYDMRRRVGVYSDGGRILGRMDGNVLTSINGTYLAKDRIFIFSRKVELDGPERTIRTDTMHYHTDTEITHFHGPTTIVQDSTTILCQRGWYDTRSGEAFFRRRARVLSRSQELQGDTIRYFRDEGLGLAWGKVVIIDTANAMVVRGEVGRYNEREDRLMVTRRAEMVMVMSGDSLWLHGDTLRAAPDTNGTRRISAWRNVRFFKSDLQGVADTMFYSEADSLIRLYGDPMLWSGEDQIDGRHIRIQLSDGRPHRLHVEQDAMMASRVDSLYFDQLAGTTLTGYFEDGEMRRIVTEGNSRSIYFAREETEAGERIIGVDHAECSRIDALIEDGAVRTITFHNAPDADLHPLDKAPEDALQLEGFNWAIERRPADRNDIFPR